MLVPEVYQLRLLGSIEEYEYQVGTHEQDDEGNQHPAKHPNGGKTAEASEHQ